MDFKFLVSASICLSILCINNLFAQTVSTIIGNGSSGFGGDGYPATSSTVKINGPAQIALDAAGNVYFADESNDCVRKLSTSGIITTVAGIGGTGGGYSGDGFPATSALMQWPLGLAIDAAGNMYISDINNSIRKVDPSGIITTIAYSSTTGFGGDSGLASAALINNPAEMAIDNAGNLYFADYGNNRIRKISTSGIITTVAGGGTTGYLSDGGPATNATLLSPTSVAFDLAGNMYIADDGHNIIRKVNTYGIISTIAGDSTAGYGYSGDGGAAIHAQFHGIKGITVDDWGNIYVADYYNLVIRKINTAGIIDKYVGTVTGGYFNGDGLAGTATNIGNNKAVTAKGGTLYFSDALNARVRKIGVSTSGISNLDPHDNTFGIYPNPTNGAFMISGKTTVSENMAMMNIEDVTGKVIITSQVAVNNGLFEKQLNTGDILSPGIYLVRVNGCTVQKLIKE